MVVISYTENGRVTKCRSLKDLNRSVGDPTKIDYERSKNNSAKWRTGPVRTESHIFFIDISFYVCNLMS